MRATLMKIGEAAVLIAAAYGACIAWIVVFFALLHVYAADSGASISPSLYLTESLIGKLSGSVAIPETPEVKLFITLICAPLLEEVVFRMLPLSLVLHRPAPVLRAVVLGVCCIIFGYAHGGVINVFIQGMVGLSLGFLYVRLASSQLAAYASCVAVHALYNYTVTYWWVMQS